MRKLLLELVGEREHRFIGEDTLVVGSTQIVFSREKISVTRGKKCETINRGKSTIIWYECMRDVVNRFLNVPPKFVPDPNLASRAKLEFGCTYKFSQKGDGLHDPGFSEYCHCRRGSSSCDEYPTEYSCKIQLYTIAEPRKTVFYFKFDASQTTEAYGDDKISFHDPDAHDDMVIDVRWMFDLIGNPLPEYLDDDFDDLKDEHTPDGTQFFDYRLKPFVRDVLDKHGFYEVSGEYAEEVVLDSLIFDLQDQISYMD
jgi:hypothetical protein